MNFITKQLSDTLNKRNWIKREGLQFHWYNKKYQSFDDFLDELKSTKRKAIKKERKKINEYGLTIERLTGDALNVKIWDSFYEFYLSTIDKKWGSAYLTKDFFYSINRSMKNKILLVIAKKNNDIIAGALNFVGENTLYGRNWGSKLDIPFLHFELCYYQAIEYAIENKIQIVEAGAQGHHKIQRGYIATSTYSAHYIQNDSFDKAVRGFVEMEANEINKQIEIINQQGSPYSN
jgi:predicted N-acyltransferase